MARLSAYPVFLAVYEERRLVKASERLCVTPSAVSHALRDFEQSLGTKLFERTSEGVQPTTAGQRLYAKVKPLVVGIEAAEREGFLCSDSRADAEGLRANESTVLDPIHGGNSQGGC